MANVLALAAVAALGFVMMSKSSSKVAPSTPGSLQAGTGKYDSPGGPVMPLKIEQTVTSELATDTSTTNLAELADSLTPMWPIAVNLLNARIAMLSAHPNPPAPSPPPVPVPIPVAPLPPVGPPAPMPVTPPQPGPQPMPVAPPAPMPVAPPQPAPPPDPVPTPDGPGYPSWGSTQAAQSGVTIGGLAPTLPAIPGNYVGTPTTSVQAALNAWGQLVGLTDPNFPLTTDGKYGPHTQGAAGLFQMYMNETQGSNLTVDGLAGPQTQSALVAFGDIDGGGNY